MTTQKREGKKERTGKARNVFHTVFANPENRKKGGAPW